MVAPYIPIGFPHRWPLADESLLVFDFFWRGSARAHCSQILGGRAAFRAVRPFFMGAILGQFASAGVWLVIDACTGMTDNRIFSW